MARAEDNIKSSAMTTNYNVDIGRLAALMVAERALTSTFPQSANSLRGSLATEPEKEDLVTLLSGVSPVEAQPPAPSPIPVPTDLGMCSAEENATAIASALVAPVAQAAIPAVLNNTQASPSMELYQAGSPTWSNGCGYGSRRRREALLQATTRPAGANSRATANGPAGDSAEPGP